MDLPTDVERGDLASARDFGRWLSAVLAAGGEDVAVEEKDGGVIVRFRASGMRELAWHLFTWGEQASILAPERLKAVMAAELAAAARALDRTSA